MTNPAETPAPTPGDMAKRIGALFVLALQSNDHDTRHAAAVSGGELNWAKDGGPYFTPIERLTRERDELEVALRSLMMHFSQTEYRDKANFRFDDRHPLYERARSTLQSLKQGEG